MTIEKTLDLIKSEISRLGRLRSAGMLDDTEKDLLYDLLRLFRTYHETVSLKNETSRPIDGRNNRHIP